MERNVDDLRACARGKPVYSHELLEQHFPFQDTGHYRPYAEIARVRGAQIGLELLRKPNFDALWRVREWGAWGCVNREENDGVAIEYHRGTLQLAYAMGADLFQSYNWEGINQGDRAVGYMNDALRSIRDGEVQVSARRGGSSWMPIGEHLSAPLQVDHAFPWANELSVELRAADRNTSASVYLTDGASGPVLTWRHVSADQLSTTASVHLEFGDMIHVEPDSAVMLHVVSDAGWEIRGGAEGPDYELHCNLRRQRNYSRLVSGAAP
jgi:hypothetical protein